MHNDPATWYQNCFADLVKSKTVLFAHPFKSVAMVKIIRSHSIRYVSFLFVHHQQKKRTVDGRESEKNGKSSIYSRTRLQSVSTLTLLVHLYTYVIVRSFVKFY